MYCLFVVKVTARNFFMNLINIQKMKSLVLTSGTIGCRGKFKRKKNTLLRLLKNIINYCRHCDFKYLYIKCYGYLKYRRIFLSSIKSYLTTINLAIHVREKKNLNVYSKNKENKSKQYRFYFFEKSTVPHGGCRLTRAKRK